MDTPAALTAPASKPLRAPVAPAPVGPPSHRRADSPTGRPPAPTRIDDGREPVVIRCATTADFLAALPFITGFTAENSLFLVFFRGRRAGTVARIDLPQAQTRETAGPLLDAIFRILRETGGGAAGPAIVITSGQGFAESRGTPWSWLAKRLLRRFRSQGWPLRELAVVAPDGWAGMLGDRAGERRDLSEITSNPVAAEAAAAAPAPESLDEFGRLPDPDPGRAAEVASQLAALDRRKHERRIRMATTIGRGTAHGDTAAVDRDAASQTPLRLHGAARVAEACFAKGDAPPEPRLCARLAHAAEDPGLWLVLALTALTRAGFVIALAEDRVLGRLVGLPVEAEEADGLDEAGSGIDAEDAVDLSIEGVLFAASHDAPDPARLRAVTAVLSDAAAHAPAPRRPGILALLAWAWWMRGMPTVSQRLVEQALTVDREHALARMVGRLSRVTPPWQVRGLRDAMRDAHDGKDA